MKKLILASQSPRRKALLSQLGYRFSTQVAAIDETPLFNESPKDYVLRLAEQKARAIFQILPKQEQKSTVVLGSDTCVINDGNILGKPDDEAQSIIMLEQLSGSTHQVFTSIAAINNKSIIHEVVSTEVDYKPLTLDAIKRYWQTGEPHDKAGSYAIQGIGGQFVTKINGSYSAVVGLPLYETSQMLATLGIISPIQEE